MFPVRRSLRSRFSSLCARLFDRRLNRRRRPARLGLEGLEERAVPAAYSIRLLSPEAGDSGAATAAYTGGFALAAGSHAANGALIVQADSAAAAARRALSGTLHVSLPEQSADYTINAAAFGNTAADHLPFLLGQPDAAHPELWRIALEDLAAENLQALGVDWDYNDRSWDLDVRPYQEPIVGDGTGLLGRYFAGQDLTALALRRVDPTVGFDWGEGAPAAVMPADHFAVRWSGWVQPEYTDQYTFRTTSDDGVRLWINGQLVIDNWTDHGPTTDRSAALALTAGQKYDLRMEFYENGGGAMAQLGWVSAYYQSDELIPMSQLYPEPLVIGIDGNGSGLLGVYHTGMDRAGPVAAVRIDPTVGFDWGGGAPADGVPADGFAVVWSGLVQPRYSGDYRFYSRTDDGVQLSVNGQLVIDNWTDHGPTEDRSAAVTLVAGQRYLIRMQYYENGGGAVAQLAWSSDDQVKEIIPTCQLYPDPYARNDAYLLEEDNSLAVPAAGVLSNDFGMGLQAGLVSGPSHGTLSLAADGSFTYTSLPGYHGSDAFTYRATTRDGTSADATVTLSPPPVFTWTQEPATAPVLGGLGNQSSVEGQSVHLPVQASGTGTCHFAASGLPAGLRIDETTGVISGTIDYTAAQQFGGSYQTTVVMADAQGSAIQQFHWTVTDTMQPPTLANPGDQASNTGEEVYLLLDAGNPDEDQLQFAATGLPAGLRIGVDTGEISGTIERGAADSSPATVTVSVTGVASGQSASQTFTWAVAVAEHAPEMWPLYDYFSTVGDTVDLPIDAVDFDGETLSYTATGLPAGLDIDQATGRISGTLANSAYAATPYQVTVTASDGSQNASQSFLWEVNAIHLVAVADQASVEGDNVSLLCEATDASGGTLTYDAVGLPAGLSIDADTGVISGVVTNGASVWAPYEVTVTATDGVYNSARSFAWTIDPAEPPAPPTLTNPGDQSSLSGDEVSLQVQAEDTAGYPLTYSATGLPEGLDIDPNLGLISGVLVETAASASPWTVTVAAADSYGGMVSQSFLWAVGHSQLTVSVTGLSAVEGANSGEVIVANLTSTNRYSEAWEFTATIDWGDGTTGAGVVEGEGGSFVVVGRHIYATPGTYTLGLTVSTTEGSSPVSATGVAQVTAAAWELLAGVGGVGLVGHGGLTVGYIRAAGTGLPSGGFSATIVPAVGAGEVTGMVEAVGNGLWRVGLPASYSYPNSGTYAISVTVSRNGAASQTQNGTVVVGQLVAGARATLTVATFVVADPLASGYEATVDWGDGKANDSSEDTGGDPYVWVSGSGGVFTVMGRHIYEHDSLGRENGSYPVTVHLWKTGEPGLTAKSTVIVVPAPISLQVADIQVAADGEVKGGQTVATFQDRDLTHEAGSYTAKVYGSDGSVSDGLVYGANGAFRIEIAQRYSNVGSYLVRVVVSYALGQATWMRQVGVGNAIRPNPAPVSSTPLPEYRVKKVNARAGVNSQDLILNGQYNTTDNGLPGVFTTHDGRQRYVFKYVIEANVEVDKEYLRLVNGRWEKDTAVLRIGYGELEQEAKRLMAEGSKLRQTTYEGTINKKKGRNWTLYTDPKDNRKNPRAIDASEWKVVRVNLTNSAGDRRIVVTINPTGGKLSVYQSPVKE